VAEKIIDFQIARALFSKATYLVDIGSIWTAQFKNVGKNR
jgi:hypothetical protein